MAFLETMAGIIAARVAQEKINSERQRKSLQSRAEKTAARPEAGSRSDEMAWTKSSPEEGVAAPVNAREQSIDSMADQFIRDEADKRGGMIAMNELGALQAEARAKAEFMYEHGLVIAGLAKEKLLAQDPDVDVEMEIHGLKGAEAIQQAFEELWAKHKQDSEQLDEVRGKIQES